MRKRRFLLVLAVATMLTACPVMRGSAAEDTSASPEVLLHTGPGDKPVVVRFASVDEGVKAVTRRDRYIAALSPFDRQVRLQTDRAVTEDEHLKFMAANVVAWDEGEVTKLSGALATIRGKLAAWKLPLPAAVLLVKTTGKEEAHAAYCRGNAIVLPRNVVAWDARRLESLVTHELFHVLSSHNPKLQESLYAIVGFHPCGVVELPGDLKPRAITNPDAPVVEHRIELEVGGKRVHAVPILYSSHEKYDVRRGGELFAYLNFRLMAVERRVDGKGIDEKQDPASKAPGRKQDERALWTPVIVDGKPVLLDPKDKNLKSFHDQIGRNTGYIIHPEEILADNFVMVVDNKQNAPTPRVLERMREVLTAKK